MLPAWNPPRELGPPPYGTEKWSVGVKSEFLVRTGAGAQGSYCAFNLGVMHMAVDCIAFIHNPCMRVPRLEPYSHEALHTLLGLADPVRSGKLL